MPPTPIQCAAVEVMCPEMNENVSKCQIINKLKCVLTIDELVLMIASLEKCMWQYLLENAQKSAQ